MDPLLLVLLVAGASCLFCWIASLITKDTSWVDRIWSIVPVVYVWIFAVAGILDGNDATRLVVMALLVTAWGARLTFNFARKGGYTGMEDYRWAILRGRMKPWQFQIFNLLFIVLYQNALLVLITLPALAAWQNPAPMGVWDAVFALVFLAFLVGEFIADQQQWDFHRAKREGRAEGFLASGLFAWSRHPNFFFEQAQWWAFYAIGATAAVASGLGFWGGAINWTIAGAVLLTILFIGSTIFTESISSSKYPAYAEYKRTTSMLVPLPPRRSSAKARKGVPTKEGKAKPKGAKAPAPKPA
jgi:steroid 5-alpha reductase family enzyme